MLELHRTSTLALSLLAATCLTPPDSARAEPGDPLGGEVLVNTYKIASQAYPSVTRDAEGNFVVAWARLDQDGDGHGVYAQRFDAAGALRARSSRSIASQPTVRGCRRSPWTLMVTSS